MYENQGLIVTNDGDFRLLSSQMLYTFFFITLYKWLYAERYHHLYFVYEGPTALKGFKQHSQGGVASGENLNPPAPKSQALVST